MSTQVEIINQIFLLLEQKFNINSSVVRIGKSKIKESGFRINLNLKNPCYDKLKKLNVKKINLGRIKL